VIASHFPDGEDGRVLATCLVHVRPFPRQNVSPREERGVEGKKMLAVKSGDTRCPPSGLHPGAGFAARHRHIGCSGTPCR
jgi:hypothetical protein